MGVTESFAWQGSDAAGFKRSHPLDSPLAGGRRIGGDASNQRTTLIPQVMTMFKIGDFSKLSRVSIKALRYYAEIGPPP